MITMSRNSFDYMNNAKANLEIAQRSFLAGNFNHQLELLERVNKDIQKAIELAKIEYQINR
jgi:hypothetical protein